VSLGSGGRLASLASPPPSFASAKRGLSGLSAWQLKQAVRRAKFVAPHWSNQRSSCGCIRATISWAGSSFRSRAASLPFRRSSLRRFLGQASAALSQASATLAQASATLARASATLCQASAALARASRSRVGPHTLRGHLAATPGHSAPALSGSPQTRVRAVSRPPRVSPARQTSPPDLAEHRSPCAARLARPGRAIWSAASVDLVLFVPRETGLAWARRGSFHARPSTRDHSDGFSCRSARRESKL